MTDSSSSDRTNSKTKPRTKVIIHNLPPELTEEKFLETIHAFESKYNYLDYHPGKKTIKKKRVSFAFINFINPDTLVQFYQQFSNHSFVDERGNRYKPTIQYAPFQNTPKETKVENPREGTILEDEQYLKFVEKLTEPRVLLPSAEVQLEKRLAEESKLAASSGGVMPPIISPLLADLQAKHERLAQKQATKKKDNRRRKQKARQAIEKKDEQPGARKILQRKNDSQPNNIDTTQTNSTGTQNLNNQRRRNNNNKKPPEKRTSDQPNPNTKPTRGGRQKFAGNRKGTEWKSKKPVQSTAGGGVPPTSTQKQFPPSN